MKIGIIYEDDDILVVHKPAGLATQTGQIGRQDVVSQLKNHLALKVSTNRNVDRTNSRKATPFVGVVHRLDQPVEGLLVFGKNSKATAALNKQLAGTELHKRYYAVVCGQTQHTTGELVDYLWKDSKTNSSKVIEPSQLTAYPDAKKAVLAYQVKASKEDYSLLDITIQTGRHHQIRVQLSSAGLPLAGDVKYGGTTGTALQAGNVALCAYYLKFIHPVTNKVLEYTVNPINPIFAIF